MEQTLAVSDRPASETLNPRVTLGKSVAQFISNLVIVGAGHVVNTKIWPALSLLLALGLRIRVAVCDVRSGSGLDGLAHDFFAITDGRNLPVDRLADRGYFGPRTLVVVATPSQHHVPYVIQGNLLQARLSSEKPLSATGTEAKKLLGCCTDENFFALDHFLFKADFQALLNALADSPEVLLDLARIEFVYHERAGFALGRHQEDTIADIQHHALSLITAILKIRHTRFVMDIERATVAAHAPDEAGRYAAPKVCTASRLTGWAVTDKGRAIELDLRQAKGAPANVRWLRLRDRHGNLIAQADLAESGCMPHARALRELLLENPRFPLVLQESINVMELVDRARLVARGHVQHAFGTLPSFITID